MNEYLPIIIELFNSIIPILGHFTTAIAALIPMFMLIPGEQPEKFLKKVLNFIQKFSKDKKKE